MAHGFARPLIRNIFKSSFLQYVTSLPKGSKPVNYPKYWVIFCTYRRVDKPVLEFYYDQVNTTHSAYSFSLMKCVHVCPSMITHKIDSGFEFSITLEDQRIILVADSKELMDEWITVLRTKLKELNAITSADNHYTVEPSPVTKINLTANLFRPLPPLPSNQVRLSPSNSTRGMHLLDSLSKIVTLFIYLFIYFCYKSCLGLNSSANQSSINHQLLSRLENIRIDQACAIYEPIFNGNNSFEEDDDLLPSDKGPPPYELIDSASSSSTTPSCYRSHFNMSLRESQVIKLNKEIAHKDGVRLLLRRKDCKESIAFVDWLGNVWVAGWKQKAFPQLHNSFHIGDCVMRVSGERVFGSNQVYELIEQQPLVVDIIIKRLPHGYPVLISRNYDGEDLGIIRRGNKAEIIDLVKDGLAVKHGISKRARSVDQFKSTDCNWVITEINNRPLSLFFKGDEIKDRLNSVGKDISLLLQPYDLVKMLKKKLKSFKDYKDYIVQ